MFSPVRAAASSDLTLNTTVQICRAEEAAALTGENIPTHSSVNAARKTTYQKAKSSKPAKQPATRQTSHGTCPNCGGKNHSRSACPASDKICKGCNKRGHFQSVCRKTSKSHDRLGKVTQLKLQRIHNSDHTVSLTTQLHNAEPAIQLTWLPDTGSDVDAIGLHDLKKLGGHQKHLDADTDDVRTADGSRLTSLGCISARITAGNHSIQTIVHVYDDLTDALLSRQSLEALGFLPENWPRHVRQVTQLKNDDPTPAEIAKIRADLISEFADVFSESTGHLKPMAGPDMDIILEPDAKPRRVYTARPIPYAYRDQVKQQLDDMVAEGIIEPVTVG